MVYMGLRLKIFSTLRGQVRHERWLFHLSMIVPVLEIAYLRNRCRVDSKRLGLFFLSSWVALLLSVAAALWAFGTALQLF